MTGKQHVFCTKNGAHTQTRGNADIQTPLARTARISDSPAPPASDLRAFQGQTFSFEFVSGSTNWDGSHTAKIDFLRPKYIWNISYKYVVNSEAHWNIYIQFSFNLHIPKYISKCISVARKYIYNLKYTAYMFTYRQVFLQMWHNQLYFSMINIIL